MKLNVELSPKSIEQTIKKLQFAKEQIQTTMQREFLQEICKWIIDKANYYLSYCDIGQNVKDDISIGWQYTLTKNGAKIINSAQQAVFVEFGVGIIGREERHEMVRNGSTDYEYNIGSKINKETNQWIFNVYNDQDIDIQEQYIIYRTNNTVKTKGSPAVMYCYNAVVDAKNELEKPNGIFTQKWKTLEQKYMKGI